MAQLAPVQTGPRGASRLLAATIALLAVVVLATTASAASRPTATPAVVKKCKRFSMVRVRRGRRVHVRVRKCVTVASPKCKVRWTKKRRHGKVVIRKRNPVWIAHVTCPPGQSPGGGNDVSGPIPGKAATYAITMTGTTYSGDTNFLQPTTVFTPLSQFALAGSLLVEPPVGVDLNPTGQTTNGVNARDVGFFVGSPTAGQAGALWFVTDSFLFGQVHINLPTAEVLDVAFVTANEQAGTLNIRLDGDLNGLPYARALPQNSYGLTSGLLGDLAQILTGGATLQFSPDGRTVSGRVGVLGGGIIEPGASAYSATFTGTRTS
jgi:hypothetical protein